MSKRYYQRDAYEHPDHCVGERARGEINPNTHAVVAEVDAAGRAVSAWDTDQRFRITSVEPVRVEFLAAALLTALEGVDTEGRPPS